MAPNLTSGDFRIVSLLEGHPPVGVDHIRPASQNVHLNGPVATFAVKKEGHHTYRLGVGGYPYTGLHGDKVIASIHPEQNVEWRAIYREHQDAYTIELVEESGKGWTVPHGSEPHSRVDIEVRIIIIQPSEPVRYPTSQLFRFVPVRE